MCHKHLSTRRDSSTLGFRCTLGLKRTDVPAILGLPSHFLGHRHPALPTVTAEGGDGKAQMMAAELKGRGEGLGFGSLAL